MNNLASTLRAMGEATEARKILEQVLEVRRRVLGEEHPDTLRSMNNLASTLRAMGEATEARNLHEQVLEVSRRVLGEEHPDTLISLYNVCASSEGEPDPHLVEALLQGVRKLPEKMEIRVAAEQRWGNVSDPPESGQDEQ